MGDSASKIGGIDNIIDIFLPDKIPGYDDIIDDFISTYDDIFEFIRQGIEIVKTLYDVFEDIGDLIVYFIFSTPFFIYLSFNIYTLSILV